MFLLYLSGTFYWRNGDSLAGFGFGTVLLLAAGLLLWSESRYWRLRHVPLTVHATGQVRYGQQELCPSNSVRSVRIVPDPQAESGDCKVVLELADGSSVELPGLFFGSVSHPEAARLLAGKLAKALNVEMVETK